MLCVVLSMQGVVCVMSCDVYLIGACVCCVMVCVFCAVFHFVCGVCSVCISLWSAV